LIEEYSDSRWLLFLGLCHEVILNGSKSTADLLPATAKYSERLLGPVSGSFCNEK
jgi:hypothetical protein